MISDFFKLNRVSWTKSKSNARSITSKMVNWRNVQQIFDLITQELPIAVVARLIDSFNKVRNLRKMNEILNCFTSLLRGLVADHLMRAG